MVAEDENCALGVIGCLVQLGNSQHGLAGELLDMLYFLAFNTRLLS